MFVTRLVLAVVVLVGVLAGAAVAAPPVHFQTPSHGIACWSDRAVLRCDVQAPLHPPKRPKSCRFDWGHAFELTRTGHGRRRCASDTVLDPKAPVLAYGKSKRFGAFTCRSRRTGLRCTNRAKHGFELARERQRLF